MKKHKQSLFTKKLNNLDSQDYCDEIHWSSSESSDCENKFNTLNNSFSTTRKRKRKNKVNHNLSNLNIVEVLRNDEIEHQITNEQYSEKCTIESSPILTFKCTKQVSVSPVLKPRCSKTFQNDQNILSSPILMSKQKNGKEKSPVLEPKKSPQIDPNVRKKLFIEGKQNIHVEKFINDTEGTAKKDTKQSNSHLDIADMTVSETNESKSKPKTKFDLIKRVQSYFDSNFSSESLSQQSISECESTPQNISKSSEEVEITNIITQVKDIKNQQNNSHSSCENTEKNKKRYKRDGLAYRLAGLIKKQSTNICLWQHEKFLATSSNFVIPTCEHIVFRIQNVHLKYGCYLIKAKDFKEDDYVIIINLINLINHISPNFIIKIYKPYNILKIDDYSLIVNVCKYECLPL